MFLFNSTYFNYIPIVINRSFGNFIPSPKYCYHTLYQGKISLEKIDQTLKMSPMIKSEEFNLKVNLSLNKYKVEASGSDKKLAHNK